MFYRFNSRRRPSIIAAMLLACAPMLQGDNVCDCPNPPGGQIRCGDDQVAFCWVKDGKVVGKCMDLPKTIKNASDLQVWILTIATGREIKPRDLRKSAELQNALTASEYQAPDEKSAVRFHVGEKVQRRFDWPAPKTTN